MSSMPLDGIRVLDWTIWQAGGVASAMLGDLGAEVIKIEERVSGDPGRWVKRLGGGSGDLGHGRIASFEFFAANKKSIALDLKKPKGREVVYRLASKSDVFVQNFRNFVAPKLGLDYATLSQYNSKLIYANVTAYGEKGPESQEPGLDYLGGARSGFMVAAAEPGEEPRRVEGSIHDQMTATVLAYGILAALFARERLSIGQEVHVSLLGSNIWLQGLWFSHHLMSGTYARLGSRARANNPLVNHYRCMDAKYIALCGFQSDRYWPGLCDALDIKELEADIRFDNMERRQENCAELVSILDGIFASKTCAEWKLLLKQKGDLPCAEVKSIPDVAIDPQALENEYIIDFDHPVLGRVKQVGIPVHFSKTPGHRRLPSPELGQHTEEVLLEVGGYTWKEIEELREQEVI